MKLKNFNFNFKPKFTIRLILQNEDLDFKVLNFNFYVERGAVNGYLLPFCI